MTPIHEIADAIVADLNDTFSAQFVAKRGYQPVHSESDLAGLCVDVVPKSTQTELLSRSAVMHTCMIDVGLQKSVSTTGEEEIAELDDLMILTLNVFDHLTRRKLTAVPDAAWAGVVNDPIYDPKTLLEKRVFLSVITVTYKMAAKE